MPTRRATRRGCLAIALLGFALLSAGADEPSPLPAKAPVPHGEADQDRSGSDEHSAKDKEEAAEEARERKQAYEIGMILLAGIGFLGVFLIAFVLIYSRSVRRKTRAGRKPSSPRDDLWYLKSKTPPASGSEERPQPPGNES